MADSDPDDELSAAPPTGDSLDVLLAEAVAAPATYPVLAQGTVVAGRYKIERVLGVGGMGTVYLVRDQVLDRAVALKLHRTMTAQSRLHREAIAMARLAHPNVVTVFEVGQVDERPFVAMEYIEGQTLRAWLAGAPRPRREILDALVAAGEGLAAAHAAELVHRDVKPDNILVGRDGRVRIGDFGLAQVATTRAGPVRVPIGPETATGTVVGTPAYMAPEQIDGSEIDARTDQFAFCVVAWEALAGERPFTGADTLELRAAIQRGAPRAPRSRVPPPLRQLLMRGMASEPASRWPSMEALLAALRSVRRRPQVLAAAAVAGTLALGGTAWALWPAHDPVAACADTVAELDRLFPNAAATALTGAVLDTGGAHAADRAMMISRAIGAQRVRARHVTIGACRARASRQWSSELAAASRECLLDHARTVHELLTTIPPDRATTSDLVVTAMRLPAVESCGDARMLAGWRPLAADPTQLAGVVEARARIETALVQVELGRIAAATATHRAVVDSPAGAERMVKGRAELLHGLLEIANGSYASGEGRLAEAYFAARAADDGELALRTVGELIQVTATVRRDAVVAERWIRDGLSDAERERTRHPQWAADLYVQSASAATSAGDSELALERLARAENILGEQISPQLAGGIQAVRAAALAALGKLPEAIAASERYIAMLRRSVGDRHPSVADALGDHASFLIEGNRSEEALAAATTAKAIIDAESEASSTTLAAVAMNLGATLLHIGDPAARKYLEWARASWVAAYGEDHPDVALIDTNLALFYLDAGEIERALAALRHSVVVQQRVLGEDHAELASALYNLAVAERQAGALEAALATARRAAGILERGQRGSVRHVFALAHIAMIANLANRPEEALAATEAALALPATGDDPSGPAWLQLETAKALIQLRRDPRRVKDLLERARVGYGLASLSDRVAEIDALLAKLP